ncbi:MAG TPA: PAS domain-containing protein [Methylothermaceae bacterium]|nr:PAS domain-containing protein [Methylothermaceae bacterium]
MIQLQSLDNPEKLRQAFEVFNQLSRTLTESYRELENQVARLNRELAAARSERLQTLTEKEKLANRLQRLLELLPGGVIVVDGQGRVIECNPAAVQMLGEPLLGESWSEILARSFVTTPDNPNPHERRLRNGKIVSISARPLGDEPGQILLLTDVSDMHALQSLLEQHKRLSAMGEMVASMAHQVRTPLSTAILYASQLGDDRLDPTQRQRFSARILERLRHLERQVNDMLAYAREGRFVTDPIPLAAFLKRLQQAAEPHFAAAAVRLTFTDHCPGATLVGNAEALEGAFLNLLNNALEALKRGGQVAVQARYQDDRICLSVVDDGPGMDEAVRQRIFEPFFTTRPDGTGLGLAVVESVVRAHGGSVRCDSRPGRGCAFHVYLPLAANEQPLPSGGQRRPDPGIEGEGR